MTMHTPDNEDRELEELLSEAPMGPDAPEALKRKLRSYVAYSRVRKPRTWMPRLVIVGAAAAGLCVAAMLLWPASASAKSFEKVLKATNRAKSFSISVDERDRGSRKLVKLVGADGVLDIHTPDGKHVQFESGKVSVYDPEEQTLTVVKFGSSGEMKALAEAAQQGLSEGLKRFDVKTLLAQYKAGFGEENAKVSDTYVEDGRKVYTIGLQSPRDSSRAKITVDADTDLPMRIQAHDQSGKDVDMRIEFGVDVRIEPLENSVPKDVQRKDVDLGAVMNQAGAFGKGMERFGAALGAAAEKSAK